MPLIESFGDILNRFKKDKYYGLVSFNNRKNLDLVIENWRALIEFPFLTIYFVNPNSKMDRKWILKPYTHHKICDESSLKTGLKSMFGMVDSLPEKEIEAFK